MSCWKKLFPLLLPLALCAGCAKVQPYGVEPITPAQTAAKLEKRSLQDASLRPFLAKTLGHPLASWPLKTWDIKTLTAAAYYFSPPLQVARTGVAVAQAGVITAGERPNPTLSLGPGIPSPYLFDLNLLFPIQTAGKRGYRIARAKRLTTMARLQVASAAWKVRGAVRQALLNYLVSKRTVNIVRNEEKLRRSRVSLLHARFADGQIARGPIEAARIRLTNTRLALSAEEGRVEEDRAALAAAIGIPVSGLKGARFTWPDFKSPPTVAKLSPKHIQRYAVLNRLDVRRALITYAAAQAALQLQIARQYPNFKIGPGYQYEEGHSYFHVGFSATLPIFNRNQGPIAQAEARRKQAAAKFLAIQADVIAQSQLALRRYRSALNQLNVAENSLNHLQQVQVRLVQQSFQAGQSGRMAVNQVHLESVVAAQTVLTALGRAQTALGKLEDAVQRPLTSEGSAPTDIPAIDAGTATRHSRR